MVTGLLKPALLTTCDVHILFEAVFMPFAVCAE